MLENISSYFMGGCCAIGRNDKAAPVSSGEIRVKMNVNKTRRFNVL